MSKDKGLDWLYQYFDDNVEICPGCKGRVERGSIFYRTMPEGRFHHCKGKGFSIQPLDPCQLPEEAPKFSFHVCNVKNCDSAKTADSKVWQKQGRAELKRYFSCHNIAEQRCIYHQPL